MSAFDNILNEDDDVTEAPEVEPSTATASDEPAAAAESPALEKPETSAPAPVAEEAQPITRDDGATWSEKAGRWYKDGKIVAGERPETAAAPSQPSIPSVPPTPVVEAPIAPLYEGDPWQVRGGGQKHAIPGAIVGKDGWVHLSPEHQTQHKALIAAGIEHNTNWQREKQGWQQQVKDAEARGSANAAKYNKAAVFVFDKVNDPTWLQELVSDPERALGYLRKDLGYLLKESDLNAPRAQAQPEAQAGDVEAAFGQTLNSALDELLDDAPKGLFAADDIAELRATYGRRMAAYAAEVDGAIMLDFHALRDDFAREVKLAQKAHATASAEREKARKAQAAAAFNAANQPSKPAPIPSRPTPALVAAPSGAKTKSWDQRVNDIWSEKDDDDDT